MPEKSTTKLVLALAAIAIGSLALNSAAHADSDKGNGKGRGHGSEGYSAYRYNGEDYNRDYSRQNDDDKVYLRIGDDDRVVLKRYIEEDYHKSCPPGLAKKHNGCMPPGQAKKYRIGYPLPRDVEYEIVPGYILETLRSAPRGYKYVRVDKDVLLVGEATKKVIDAVTLLSAVGN